MEEEVVHVGRKAWIAYAGVIPIVAFGSALTWYISVVVSSGSMDMPQLWSRLVVLTLLSLGILKWISLWNDRWIVTRDSLTSKRGFLPWTIGAYYHANDIHDVTYTTGFFNSIFGYSTVTITTTHGTTQYFEAYWMKNGRRLAQEISKMLGRQRAAQAHSTVAQKSRIDELKDLSELRARGDLSDEEFEALKSDILKNISDSP